MKKALVCDLGNTKKMSIALFSYAIAAWNTLQRTLLQYMLSASQASVLNRCKSNSEWRVRLNRFA